MDLSCANKYVMRHWVIPEMICINFTILVGLQRPLCETCSSHYNTIYNAYLFIIKKVKDFVFSKTKITNNSKTQNNPI